MYITVAPGAPFEVARTDCVSSATAHLRTSKGDTVIDASQGRA